MKNQIKKNKLDLEYRECLQKINAIYLGLSIGTLSFVGTWIWKPEYYWVGIYLTSILWILLLLWHWSTKKRMGTLLKRLSDLEG